VANGEVRPWASLNWPNRISILRLLLVAPFIVLLLNQEVWPHARHAAMLIFAVMALSDFADGVLARKLCQRTRLGAILDPLADKVLIICSVVLLSLPHSAVPGAAISNWVVVVVVGKDLWVILGFIVIYLVTDKFRIRTTMVGKITTVGQLVMVTLVLLAPDLNAAWRQLGSRLAATASWAVAGLSVVAIISYARLGLRFLAGQDRPLEPNREADTERHEHG